MSESDEDFEPPTRVETARDDVDDELGRTTIDDLDGGPTVPSPISEVRPRTAAAEPDDPLETTAPEDADAAPLEGSPTRIEPARASSLDAPATRVDGPRAADDDEPPTIVRPDAATGATAIDMRTPEAPGAPEATVEVDPSVEGVTTRQAAPAPAAPLPETVIKPITTPREEAFESPTLVPAPPTTPAPADATPARPAAAPRRRGRIALAAVAVIGTIALFAVAGWAVSAALVDAARDPSVTETPRVAEVEGEPDAPEVPDDLAPLAEAPPLPDAANLVATGRFREAARAYGALAREHPDRPELATMARILRQKAAR